MWCDPTFFIINGCLLLLFLLLMPAVIRVLALEMTKNSLSMVLPFVVLFRQFILTLSQFTQPPPRLTQRTPLCCWRKLCRRSCEKFISHLMVEWCERMSINWPNIFNSGGQTQTQTWVACFFFLVRTHCLCVMLSCTAWLIRNKLLFFRRLPRVIFLLLFRFARQEITKHEVRSFKWLWVFCIFILWKFEGFSNWRLWQVT